jgi:hypothetical protein
MRLLRLRYLLLIAPEPHGSVHRVSELVNHLSALGVDLGPLPSTFVSNRTSELNTFSRPTKSHKEAERTNTWTGDRRWGIASAIRPRTRERYAAGSTLRPISFRMTFTRSSRALFSGTAK